MGTFLVVAGRVTFPSAAAVAKWKASTIDGASVGDWSEPLEGPAGDPFDGMTVGQAFAEATEADFEPGRVAIRTDDLDVSLAAGLEEGDGIAIWGPILVAAMRRASSVKGKGGVVVGYGDEEHRTRVSISAKGSSMNSIDDHEDLMAAHDTVLPAFELYTGDRTALDTAVPIAVRAKKPTAKGKAKSAKAKKARPVKRPLGWKRVKSGTTASLRALAMRRGGIVWAAGDKGTLVTGAVEVPWARVETSTKCTFWDICLDGERRIWVAGGELLRSDDGGKTFNRATPEGLAADITAIWGDGDRVLCGDAVGNLRLSDDAGSSWSTILTLSDGPACFTRIRETGGALWATGTYGTVLVSHDRGATFEPVPAEPTAYMDVVHLGEKRVLVAFDGIVAGDPPVDIAPKHDRDADFANAAVTGSVLWVRHLGVLRTEDGGQTWEQAYARDSDFPYAMIALGPRSALIVGPDGSAWLGS